MGGVAGRGRQPPAVGAYPDRQAVGLPGPGVRSTLRAGADGAGSSMPMWQGEFRDKNDLRLHEHGSPVAIVGRGVQGAYAGHLRRPAGRHALARLHPSVSHHHGKACRNSLAAVRWRVHARSTNADGDSVRETNATAWPARAAFAVIVLAGVAACGTRPAPEYGGRWKPVNRYAETAREIPLHEAYVFHPSPMDRTLKAMLERWARDAGQPLSYLHDSDFTLHAGVAGIRTGSLAEAAAQLSAAYAGQGISVRVEDGRIVVRGPGASAVAASAPQSSP